MGREYKNNLLLYLFFTVVIQFSIIFFALPLSLISILYKVIPTFSIEQFSLPFEFSRTGLGVPLIGSSIIMFVSTLSFLTSDAFVCLFYTPFFAKWAVKLEKDGIYGSTLIERLLMKDYQKLCDWEEILLIQKKGLNFLDFAMHRIYFHLKNGKRFAIVRIANNPHDANDYFKTENPEEHDNRYSVFTFLAYVSQRVSKDKFKGFSKKFWIRFEKAERELQWLAPIDEEREKERQERLAIIAKEEEEEI